MIKITITSEQLEHLPSDLHKMVAWHLIRVGQWVLSENTTATGKQEAP